MDLSVVIVSFNTRTLLEECLRSVYDQTQEIDFEVIVVDNRSTDGSIELVKTKFPRVMLIGNSENKGFAAGNNQGFGIAGGRNVLMLNSDTVVLNGALEKMVCFLDEHPSAGIAGCTLLNSDGSLQPSVRSFPTVWNLFCEASFLYRVFPHTVAFGQYHMTYFKYDSNRHVDWVSGACLMFKRSILQSLGGLDERFFMYSEETDFCFRARQIGFQCWFTPGARVLHHRFASSTDEAIRIKRVLASQLLFIRKHYRDPRRFAMQVLVFAGIVIRIIGFMLSGLLLMNKVSLRKAQDLSMAMKANWRTKAERGT